MSHALHRSLLLPAAALLLGACATDATTAPATPAVRGAATAAAAPLLRWAPAVGAAAAYDFAVAPDGRVWAAGDVEGVFVSDRGTLRWRRAAALPADVVPSAVATTPDGAVLVGTTQGVWRSDDAGASWKPTALAEGYVRQLDADARGSLYAGVQGMGGGILRSDDGGASWRMMFGPFQGRGGIIDWVSVRKEDVLVGVYSQTPVYSRDGGSSWEYLGALWELPAWNAFANHMIETSRGTLLATWARGIARSVDGGLRFEHTYDVAQVHELAEDAATGAIYGMRDDGSVVKSTDDGVTWSLAVGPYQPRNVSALTVAPDGGLLLGTWKGVWRTVP